MNVLERDERVHDKLDDLCDQHFVCDAADLEALMRAGLENAPSVLLTTNDDAMNVYLAVYCRRLKPDLRIVSRITHERTLKRSIGAGADFVLSYSTLGAEAVFPCCKAMSSSSWGKVSTCLRSTSPLLCRGRHSRKLASALELG